MVMNLKVAVIYLISFFIPCCSDVQYTDSQMHIHTLPDHLKELNFQKRY